MSDQTFNCKSIAATSHSRASGLTLIETLLAMVLCSVLMAAVLTILAQVTREHAHAIARGPQRKAQYAGLHGLLQHDLSNARLMAHPAGTHKFAFRGSSGLDRDTNEDNGRDVEVTYELRTLDSKSSVLIRRQRYLESLSSIDETAEIVSMGVLKFELESTDLAPPVPASSSDGFLPIPDTLILRLWTTANETPDCVETFTLHLQ